MSDPITPAGEETVALNARPVLETGTLNASTSAIGFARVDGDAQVRLSAVPLLVAKGDAEFRQAYASAFIAGGTVSVSQGGAPMIAGRSVSVERGAGVAVVAGEATVRRGLIGVLLAKDARLSEDSRVLLSTKAALIIALALLGGFGLVAAGLVLGAKRIAEWRPDLRLWGRD